MSAVASKPLASRFSPAVRVPRNGRTGQRTPECSAPAAPDMRAISARLTAVGVAGNVALAAFKLVAGVVGHSSALISDAAHSLSDVLATLIAYVGVRASRRKPDAHHPFGHERFECLATMALAVVLAATGLGIGAGSVASIASGSYLTGSTPGMVALLAAAVSIAVKEAMFRYTRRQARIANSSAFMADAWHHRSDALSSVGALAGVAGCLLGAPICDPLASIAICLVILKVALDTAREALDGVMDVPCDEELVGAIRACAAETEGVARVDEVRSRRFGSKAYIELEIGVPGDTVLAQAHELELRVHDAVERRFPTVKHVAVRANPL